jgi:hypothetical protein
MKNKGLKILTPIKEKKWCLPDLLGWLSSNSLRQKTGIKKLSTCPSLCRDCPKDMKLQWTLENFTQYDLRENPVKTTK